jgi:transcriptional regulator with XRE-family HTH domain
VVPVPREERLIRAVGRRVAELREARGWTQSELGERLGIALKGVQRIEHGKMNLTLRSLVRIAAALGSAVPDLFVPPKRANPAGPGRPPSRSG